jgi:hypothetical protein
MSIPSTSDIFLGLHPVSASPREGLSWVVEFPHACWNASIISHHLTVPFDTEGRTLGRRCQIVTLGSGDSDNRIQDIGQSLGLGVVPNECEAFADRSLLSDRP